MGTINIDFSKNLGKVKEKLIIQIKKLIITSTDLTADKKS